MATMTFPAAWAAQADDFWRRRPDGAQAKLYALRVVAAVTDTALIDFIKPAFGPAAGGTVVHIYGAGFASATGVNFATTAGTSFVVVDDNEIKVTAPAHAAGAVDVVVLDPGGNATLTAGFTYQ